MICIYKITNTKNGKVYIGLTTNYKVRVNRHKQTLRRNEHKNTHLQRAYNKYGAECFEFTVLEECTIDELQDKEEFWFQETRVLKNGYNVKESGDCGSHTEETKKKISDFFTGSKHPNSIFFEKDVLDIRIKYDTGKYTQNELAKEFNCTNYSISNIVLGKSWKHVGGPIQKPNKHNKTMLGKGEESLKSKLKEEDVMNILKKFDTGNYLYADLAREYGVTGSTISTIIKGESWKHLKRSTI